MFNLVFCPLFFFDSHRALCQSSHSVISHNANISFPSHARTHHFVYKPRMIFSDLYHLIFKLCLILSAVLSPTHLVSQSPSAILQSILIFTTRIVRVGQQHLCQPADQPSKEMTTNNQVRKWWTQAGHQSLQHDTSRRDPITIKAGLKGDHPHMHINKGMPTGQH